MYTVDYFIKKFEAIPETHWCVGDFRQGDAMCAIGHCGLKDEYTITEESSALKDLFLTMPLHYLGNGYLVDGSNTVYSIKAVMVNDGRTEEYQQPTPKQRILAALYDIRISEIAKAKNLELVQRLEPVRNKSGKKIYKAIFRCYCGEKFTAIIEHIQTGNTKSCGCYRKKWMAETFVKHGKAGHPIYQSYFNMIDRCYNPESKYYKDYGGRGVSVCQRWQESFEDFYKWAKQNNWANKLTIDRIDNDGNYEPSNCRWATRKVQSFNKRNTNKITFKGITKPMVEWAAELGGGRGLINSRLKTGWSLEKAITTPATRSKRKDCIRGRTGNNNRTGKGIGFVLKSFDLDL